MINNLINTPLISCGYLYNFAHNHEATNQVLWTTNGWYWVTSYPSVPHQLALGYKPSHPPLLCPPTQNLPNIDLMKSPASCPRSITAASQCVWALRLHYHLQMSPAVSRSFLHIILYLTPCFYHFRIHFFFHDHASSSSQSPPEQTIHP